MAFSGFHPVVREWFGADIGEPTAAQQSGWEAIADGRHTLIAAPTGSGKTLAAFLSAINALFVESLAAPLPGEVRVVYVSPLKALSTDIHKNLAAPCAGISRVAKKARPGRARDHRGGEDRRHNRGRSGRDAADAAADPGDHAASRST